MIKKGRVMAANPNPTSRAEYPMRQPSSTASVLVSHLLGAVRTLVTFLSPWDGQARRYRPEDHYMRGPGPKWREKHILDRASSGT